MEAQNDFNFTGNVEAKTLMDGNVDVVVTDGFTGNMVLKTQRVLLNQLAKC